MKKKNKLDILKNYLNTNNDQNALFYHKLATQVWYGKSGLQLYDL